ncbi:unnamed protein product, partial [Rotaria sp. Silwood1]
MSTARSHHAVTILADGKVLAAGGRGDRDVLSSAELYNP